MADTATMTDPTREAPDGIERKQFSFAAQCKMLEDGDGGFDGIASPFGKLDDADDIIVAGTYTDTITDFLRDGWVAPDHKWGVAHDVGIYSEARETDEGLYVVGSFHPTPDAQAIRAKTRKRLESGKSVKLSIGFVTLQSESMPGKEAVKYLRNPTPQEKAYCESRSWVRVIFKVKLYEVSLVSVPAASQADVISVKSTAMNNTNAKTADTPAATAPVPETKTIIEHKEGSVLGEWVGKDATCRAICAVIDALQWLIYDCIYPWPSDAAPSLEDRIGTLRRGWGEGLELIITVMNAILGDEAEESQEGAIEMLSSLGIAALAERKEGKIERKAGASPVGVPLHIHSERVLAAATGLKDRLSSLHDLRKKEGRTFSQANCDRIEEHCKALDTVVIDLRGMLAGATVTKEEAETASSASSEAAESKDGTGDESASAPSAATPGLQAYIRTKYNAFMETTNNV